MSSLIGLQPGSGASLAKVVMVVAGWGGVGGSCQTVGIITALCDDFRASAGSVRSQLTPNRAVSDHL